MPCLVYLRCSVVLFDALRHLHRATMEACGITGGNQVAPVNYVFVSRPNRSMTPRQQSLVFWSVALLCLGYASVFAGLGYWLVLPFAGLEIGVLAWAFQSMRAHDADYESITIQGQRLLLEWRDAGQVDRREWNTCWTRAECVCQYQDHQCHFCVSSHGEAIELGRYLDDQGRIQLARTVRANLCS